jgi:hypothetical protein
MNGRDVIERDAQSNQTLTSITATFLVSQARRSLVITVFSFRHPVDVSPIRRIP